MDMEGYNEKVICFHNPDEVNGYLSHRFRSNYEKMEFFFHLWNNI